MRAKIHIKLKGGQAIESLGHGVGLDSRQIYFTPTEPGFSECTISLERIEELTIKPMVDNPNAEVEQVFPKGRW